LLAPARERPLEGLLCLCTMTLGLLASPGDDGFRLLGGIPLPTTVVREQRLGLLLELSGLFDLRADRRAAAVEYVRDHRPALLGHYGDEQDKGDENPEFRSVEHSSAPPANRGFDGRLYLGGGEFLADQTRRSRLCHFDRD